MLFIGGILLDDVDDSVIFKAGKAHLGGLHRARRIFPVALPFLITGAAVMQMGISGIHIV